MSKLTPSQFLVLSSARDRDDGLATRPATLRAAAAAKLVASLCDKGFVREIRAKPEAPVWREDDTGRFALKVLKAGRLAAEAQAETVAQPEAADAEIGDKGSAAADTAPATGSDLQTHTSATSPTLPIASPAPTTGRTGSKRAQVIALLRRPDGAAMVDLIAATCWLPHTTRAALSGLRKSGLALQRFSDEDGVSRYRIQDMTDGDVADIASPQVNGDTGNDASACTAA